MASSVQAGRYDRCSERATAARVLGGCVAPDGSRQRESGSFLSKDGPMTTTAPRRCVSLLAALFAVTSRTAMLAAQELPAPLPAMQEAPAPSPAPPEGPPVRRLTLEGAKQLALAD